MTTITKEFLQQLADHHAGDEYYPLLIDLLNQPEPEPIYQWKAPYSGAWRDISKDAYLEIKGYIHNITGNGEVRVVYTHPPAPELKPLSLDEIHQRYKNLRGNEPPHYIDIYRDAEAALGILRGGL